MTTGGVRGGGHPLARPHEEGLDLCPALRLIQDPIHVAAVRRSCSANSTSPSALKLQDIIYIRLDRMYLGPMHSSGMPTS